MPDMLAALWNGVDTVDIKSVPCPTPGPDDALVRVMAEGICGSDLNFYRRLSEPETVPGGHETAGEIVEVGPCVDPSIIGQRVAVEVIGHGNACLQCWYCRRGQYTHCIEKRDWGGGGFAEYVTRRAAGCYPLPDSMTWEEGALVEPLAVSIRGLHRGGLAAGDTVVVLGAGNIGLTAIAAARALGAGKVIATAKHAHQVELAKKLGADVVLDPADAAAKDAVADLTEGPRSRHYRGDRGGIRQCLYPGSGRRPHPRHGAHRRARGVLRSQSTDWIQPLIKEQSVIFSLCYGIADGKHEFQTAIDLMASGKVDLKPMVTHTYPLTEMPQALATAYDKSSGSIKVQLRP